MEWCFCTISIWTPMDQRLYLKLCWRIINRYEQNLHLWHGNWEAGETMLVNCWGQKSIRWVTLEAKTRALKIKCLRCIPQDTYWGMSVFLNHGTYIVWKASPCNSFKQSESGKMWLFILYSKVSALLFPSLLLTFCLVEIFFLNKKQIMSPTTRLNMKAYL